MLAKRNVLTVLGLALMTAGCLGSDAPEDAALAAASQEGGTGDEPSAGEDEAAPGAPAGPEPAPARVIEEEFQGNLANYAVLCAGPAGTRQCADSQSRSSTLGTVIEYRGNLSDVDVEMTWTSQGPGRETLGLMVMTCDKETGACAEAGRAQGASPLALRVEGVGAADNRTLYVHAYMPTQNAGAAPATLYYELDQPFLLAIHATLRAAA